MKPHCRKLSAASYTHLAKHPDKLLFCLTRPLYQRSRCFFQCATLKNEVGGGVSDPAHTSDWATGECCVWGECQGKF